MTGTDDARLAEAKAADIMEIANRLGLDGLKRAGREWVGPCPVCGGSDRFGISPDRGVYNCRSCGGGDAIGLVRLVRSCGFRDALDFIVGAADVPLDPREAARRARAAAETKRRREERAERERAAAIGRAREIWRQGVRIEATSVQAYLHARGLTARRIDPWPRALRYHPELPYMVPNPDGQGWTEIHRGPAMLASIVNRPGELVGVHRTWIDPDRPGKKADLGTDAAGKPRAAKKVEGSLKGAAIRLTPHMEFETLIMGEGIETTLSARAADPVPGAAYWAGISLGNMGGRRVLTARGAEALGLPGKGVRAAGIPDMEDADAFVPPPFVRRLVFVQDGDSDPETTRAILLAGLRRAMALIPGLEARIVHPGEGRDLNDVLMGVAA